MLKILHISTNYFGSEAFRKIIDISKKKFETIVYVPSKSNSPTPIIQNNEIIVFKGIKKLDILFYFNKIKKCFNYIYSFITENKLEFSLVHAHTLFLDGGIAYLLKKQLQIKYIVTIRNTDINSYFKYLFFIRPFGVRILFEAERIILLSPAFKKSIFKKYIPKRYWKQLLGKIEILPNGIDKFWFENKANKSNNINNDKINLLYSGRFYFNKNILRLIRVHKKLKKINVKNSLTLVGNNNKTLFEKYIYKISKSNSEIITIPKISKEELIQLYIKCDIFTMPSHYESFGLSYIEAMSQGKPIVYTKNQGIDKYFPDGHVGYSVNSRSTKSIVEAILKIKDKYEIISKNCIESIDFFKWEKIEHNYLNLLRKTIK